MPFDQNDWSNKKLLPYFEIRKRIEEKYKLIRNKDPITSTSKVLLNSKIFRRSLFQVIKEQ